MADDPAAAEAALIDAMRGIISGGTMMVTGWICVIEYLDETGTENLSAYASNMSPWKLSGMSEAGLDLLMEEFQHDESE